MSSPPAKSAEMKDLWRKAMSSQEKAELRTPESRNLRAYLSFPEIAAMFRRELSGYRGIMKIGTHDVMISEPDLDPSTTEFTPDQIGMITVAIVEYVDTVIGEVESGKYASVEKKASIYPIPGDQLRTTTIEEVLARQVADAKLAFCQTRSMQSYFARLMRALTVFTTAKLQEFQNGQLPVTDHSFCHSITIDNIRSLINVYMTCANSVLGRASPNMNIITASPAFYANPAQTDCISAAVFPPGLIEKQPALGSDFRTSPFFSDCEGLELIKAAPYLSPYEQLSVDMPLSDLIMLLVTVCQSVMSYKGTPIMAILPQTTDTIYKDLATKAMAKGAIRSTEAFATETEEFIELILPCTLFVLGLDTYTIKLVLEGKVKGSCIRMFHRLRGFLFKSFPVLQYGVDVIAHNKAHGTRLTPQDIGGTRMIALQRILDIVLVICPKSTRAEFICHLATLDPDNAEHTEHVLNVVLTHCSPEELEDSLLLSCAFGVAKPSYLFSGNPMFTVILQSLRTIRPYLGLVLLADNDSNPFQRESIAHRITRGGDKAVAEFKELASKYWSATIGPLVHKALNRRCTGSRELVSMLLRHGLISKTIEMFDPAVGGHVYIDTETEVADIAISTSNLLSLVLLLARERKVHIDSMIKSISAPEPAPVDEIKTEETGPSTTSPTTNPPPAVPQMYGVNNNVLFVLQMRRVEQTLNGGALTLEQLKKVNRETAQLAISDQYKPVINKWGSVKYD